MERQHNNVLYWFRMEDNSDSCLYFLFLFFFSCLFACPFFTLEHCFHIFLLGAQAWTKSHGKLSSHINFRLFLKASIQMIEAHLTSAYTCSGRLAGSTSIVSVFQGGRYLSNPRSSLAQGSQISGFDEKKKNTWKCSYSTQHKYTHTDFYKVYIDHKLSPQKTQ